MSLESAYNTIEKLVEDFKANEKHYLLPEYSESQARKDYIDKFFTALGWDVDHIIQKNPYEQEVKVERTVKTIGGSQKKADYSFALTPKYKEIKFFVEATNPFKALANEEEYFQAVRYGWNAVTPFVVLTDFEEFHVLDSRYKPDVRSILKRKYLAFKYEDYLNLEKFKEIYYLFSREAVADGQLEKRANELPRPKGGTVQTGLFASSYKDMDEEFLEELDEIRFTLAKSFKKNNPDLNSEMLTEATQRTIDRLVFLRFLEDKEIEGENHVDYYGSHGKGWDEFIGDSKKLDKKYNGIVFKKLFIDEDSFNGPDDKEFLRICNEISYKNSPYHFNYVPIHILGSIYERFLGKVVVVNGKKVEIDQKPEVSKAGGVFYTPQYIVQYIVDNSVGKLIEGKTPKEISKLRFADISCGSGSFLITVYDILLKYYAKYYKDNPEEAKKDGCIYKAGQWVLSLTQKKDILLNNIYGVDIDSQAVEVTQLSLFLKLLEDETLVSIHQEEMSFLNTKVLPDLSKNIICGNSLIGRDIIDGKLFTNDKERKINAMDFEDPFPSIMKSGGFNAIVGNPPYILIQDLFRDELSLEYFKNHYYSSSYKIDTYHLFFERSLKVLKKGGVLGYITPSNYLTNNGLKKLREYLLNNSNILQINVINGRVFQNASVDTALTILLKSNDTIESQIINSIWSDNVLINKTTKNFSQKNFFENKNFIFTSTNSDEIRANIFKLGDDYNVKFGMQLRDRKTFLSDVILNTQSKLITKFHKECYTGRDIQRYLQSYNGLLAYTNREAKRGGCWDFDMHETNPKILVRQIGKFPICSLDEKGYYCLNTLFMITPKKKDSGYSINYILGILNSSFIKHYWIQNFYDLRQTFPKIKGSYLEELPIAKLDLRNQKQKSQHDKLANFVNQMLEAKKHLAGATTDKDINFYESKCSSLDRQIDRLVYELYGLTEDEIRIIEG